MVADEPGPVNTTMHPTLESMMEQPKIEIQDDLIPAQRQLDTEDAHELIYECYDLLTRILDRTNPKWIANEGNKLIERLEVTLSWHKIH
jgi:hypothetical protein